MSRNLHNAGTLCIKLEKHPVNMQVSKQTEQKFINCYLTAPPNIFSLCYEVQEATATIFLCNFQVVQRGQCCISHDICKLEFPKKKV